MSNRTVFILGASSDIGKALAGFYLENGDTVLGTYRDSKTIQDLLNHPRAHFLTCDISKSESIEKTAEAFAELGRPWDLFISAVGTLEPIGSFFECNFDEWEKSLIVNSTAQLRFLHAVYSLRNKNACSHVAFFAGGGTNNPFPNFSAYCASKILLIKMCELLDSENSDLNVFIVGPGWVRTKIHEQVLQSGSRSGVSYEKTQVFLKSGSSGTSYEEIYRCIQWCVEQGKEVAGGRNFSVAHDPWFETDLARQLRQDPEQFKLRRHANVRNRGEGSKNETL